MNAHLDQLELVLANQVAGLTALCNWQLRKIELIKGRRVQDLAAFVQREEEQVARLQQAESQRQALMGLLALEMGLDAAMPLSELLPHLPEAYQERLGKRREQLRALVEKLREHQPLINELLRVSLDYVHFSMDIFAKLAAVVRPSSYGSTGDVAAPQLSSWLVDRQA
ncbi:MAG TPA: flagellar export chaperone FlgN [Oscillatoriaceae cyanobacterium]